MPWLRCVAAFVLTVAGGVSVRAGEAVPSRSAPWNYITDDDSNTTSHCIGRPDTALCAAETLLACFLRGQFELCRMVDDGAGQYVSVFSSPAPRGRFLAYRIVETRIVADDSTSPDDPSAQAGDVVMVIDQREGALGEMAAATGAPPQRFVLRHDGAGWKVAHWGGPGD